MATATYIVAGLVAAGGLFGYLKTGSVISVVMASAFGVGLAYAGSLISNPATARSGTQLAFAISLVLAAVMGVRFYGSGKVMPAGVVALLSGTLSLYHASRLL